MVREITDFGQSPDLDLLRSQHEGKFSAGVDVWVVDSGPMPSWDLEIRGQRVQVSSLSTCGCIHRVCIAHSAEQGDPCKGEEAFGEEAHGDLVHVVADWEGFGCT